MQISRYANMAEHVCSVPSSRTLFPAEDHRYLHILDISSHCIGAIVPRSSRLSEPLIRISLWIELLPRLTDSLECSQENLPAENIVFRFLRCRMLHGTRSNVDSNHRCDGVEEGNGKNERWMWTWQRLVGVLLHVSSIRLSQKFNMKL